MTTGENHIPWPPWATTPAEDIRQLLSADQWGPWKDNLNCLQSTPIPGIVPAGLHPAEPPFFFFCRAHLEQIRSKRGTTRPWLARDQGLCVSCGEPAERKPVTMAAPVACVEAERTGSTVARLMTKSYCAKCNPYNVANLPLCRGRACRETGRERRVQRSSMSPPGINCTMRALPSAASRMSLRWGCWGSPVWNSGAQ